MQALTIMHTPSPHCTLSDIPATPTSPAGAATRLNHLLPAPYQDAVALVGDPPGAEPSSWDLRQVLGQLVAPSGPQALAHTSPLLLQLVSFDDVLELQPKVRGGELSRTV
jgi:hypothetical protein